MRQTVSGLILMLFCTSPLAAYGETPPAREAHFQETLSAQEAGVLVRLFTSLLGDDAPQAETAQAALKKIQVARFDLNGDGRNELAFRLEDFRWCGQLMDCPLYIIQEREDPAGSHKLIGSLRGTALYWQAGDRAQNGNLIVASRQMSGTGKRQCYSFSTDQGGEIYLEPTASPCP